MARAAASRAPTSTCRWRRPFTFRAILWRPTSGRSTRSWGWRRARRPSSGRWTWGCSESADDDIAGIVAGKAGTNVATRAAGPGYCTTCPVGRQRRVRPGRKPPPHHQGHPRRHPRLAGFRGAAPAEALHGGGEAASSLSTGGHSALAAKWRPARPGPGYRGMWRWSTDSARIKHVEGPGCNAS
jgi:hypothetical protein